MSKTKTIPSYAIVRALSPGAEASKRKAAPGGKGRLILAALVAAVVMELTAYFVCGGIW